MVALTLTSFASASCIDQVDPISNFAHEPPNIAILLFTNDLVGVVSIEVGSGSYVFVPGQDLGESKMRGFSSYRHISDINISADVREKIINASQSMANQICDHFALERQDTPCILVLSKGISEPSVIPTRGEADVEVFYNFLKDLRKIADVLPSDFDLNEPLLLAESLIERGQLAEAVTNFEGAELEFQEAKNACVTSLERFLISFEQAQALFKNAQEIRHVVSLVYRYPLPAKDIPSHQGFQQAYENAAFRECCKELGRALQRRGRSQKILVKRKEQAKQFLHWSGNVRSIEEAINELCKQYENKFLWRARLRPLKEIMKKAVRGGKTVQELISLEESIKKLIVP
jgi:tetratricopeptide (TPR) repeat protein